MDINELKESVNAYRTKLEESGGGKLLRSSKHGPVGISTIDDIVAAMEAMDERINALESK